ncbi:hypothetical protein ACIBSV_36920 [Embleya sp. NPDC050154]|uniref:hypothetical protein n=1 Tax=Embleya sp. NPDC050154 TaxID=3363988 RepID=UPI0037BA1CA4
MTKIGGTPESAAAEAGAWRCEVCGTTLGGKTRRGRPRRCCSRACQQTAYRRRHGPTEEELRDQTWAALEDVRAGLRDGGLAADLRGLGLTGEQLRVAHREATAAVAALRALASLRALARLVPIPAVDPPVGPVGVGEQAKPVAVDVPARVDEPSASDPAQAPAPVLAAPKAAHRKARSAPALPGSVEMLGTSTSAGAAPPRRGTG